MLGEWGFTKGMVDIVASYSWPTGRQCSPWTFALGRYAVSFFFVIVELFGCTC